MNKELLKKTMREFKKASKVKYAITNPDSLGDCMSCVNYALSDKYGEDSKGVWVKHWTRGMNAGTKVESLKGVYIAHDIDEEQAKVFYEVFGKNYNVFPKVYDPYKCFEIYENGTDIFEVTYFDTALNKSYSTLFADEKVAKRHAEWIKLRGDATNITITQIV